MNWDYKQPVPILFGSGRICELGDEIKKLGGSRGILITSPSFEKRGMVEKVRADAGGLICCVYSRVSPNPDVTECQACADLIRAEGCDFVVALGGGSVMDCAKAAAVVCRGEHSAAACLDDVSLLPGKGLPLIAVPTTAGTASEVTCVSVLSNHALGFKKPMAADALYPTLALVDPELTHSVPPYITACTGLDVLCHALEAYWNRLHQPICDLMAVHAISLVLSNLRTACREPGNAAAREAMAEASVIAGLAFNLPKTNCSHACSYPLTVMLDIPHGEACALTIDYFMRINAAQDADGRLQALANQLGFANALALADEITALKKDIGARMDLKSFNLSDQDIEKLAQDSMYPNLKKNPVEITLDMIREMYVSLC